MKIAILNDNIDFSDTNLAQGVITCPSSQKLMELSVDKIDCLVVCKSLDGDEVDQISERISDNAWKLYIDQRFKDQWDGALLSPDLVIEYFDELKSIKILFDDNEEELRKHGIDLSQEANYDIAENNRLQEAVDRTYANREVYMSIDDRDDEGLNFNMPDSEGSESNEDTSEADDLSIDLDLDDDDSLELSSGDDLPDNIESDADSSDDLDLGDASDADLSLADENDNVLELNAGAEQEDDGLDLGDMADDDLSLSDGDDDDIQTIDLSDDNDLDFDSDDEKADESIGEETSKTIVGQLDEVLASARESSEATEDIDLSESDESDWEPPKAEEGDLDELSADSLDQSLDKMISEETDLASEDLTSEFTLNTSLDALGDIDEDIDEDTEESIDVDQLLNGRSGSEGSYEEPSYEESSESYDYDESSTPSHSYSSSTSGSDDALISNLSSNELLDLKVTLGELKKDRENLLAEISDKDEANAQLKQENLTLKADIDEMKIEVSILKKRHLAEIEELKHRVSLAEEKKDILDAKNKSYQREMDRIGQKMRVDFSKIKQREKDLEGQIELLTMDTDSKIKSRDMKILELKRKIDSLEFNMESVSIKERQSRSDKAALEGKLNKVVGTLRNSLNFLEEEVNVDDLKKDLDL